MITGKKVEVEEIKTQEVILAKYGLLSLSCEIDPITQTFEYKVFTNQKLIIQTESLQKAVREYNSLTQ